MDTPMDGLGPSQTASNEKGAVSNVDDRNGTSERNISLDNRYTRLDRGPFFVYIEHLEKNLGTMSKQNIDVHTETLSDDLSDEGTTLPPTYVVLRIASDIHPSTLLWLVDKIRGKRRDGGAELIVMKQSTSEQGIVLHVSASKIKFLEVAEEIEIVKEDRTGLLREFVVSQLEEFLLNGMHVDDLLSVSEKQRIILHELENIRALAEDGHIPGYPTFTLYEGQSIFQVCIQYKVVTAVFPLHDYDTLKKISKKWYLSFAEKQPQDEIREYFGETIALYFTFLGFYTTALIVPMILGFLHCLTASETVPYFCVFNVVWVTVVLEVWKRRSNELAFKWGTIGMTSLDEPRPNFHGAMGVDAVTGRIQPQYPRYFTTVKMYCVSLPIVFLCMIGSLIVMLSSFWVEDYLRHAGDPYQSFASLSSVIYSILVFVMNTNYRRLATFLTEWENHRTQSQYDRHRVTKLVLFEFVNNFMSLFYIAFVIQDMEMLRSQLKTMLIILQAINNFQEAVLPLVIKYYTVKMGRFREGMFKKGSQKQAEIYKNCAAERSYMMVLNVPEIPPDDSRIEAANKEAQLEIYEGVYDDYLELFIQFGYVFLFSPVYPMAAFWALLNNIIEIRADAFKLCKIYQRPMSRRSKDIGAWQRAFEILGALSILTNCGLLYLSPSVRKRFGDWSQVETLLVFVLLEHLLLGIRFLLHISISDKPESIRVALAKRNYESKQALKNERAQRNRRLLTRKFKTVHGAHCH